MNAEIEAFRRDPEDEAFHSFRHLPMYAPGCYNAEPNYRKVLGQGIRRGNDLIDPAYPTSIIGGLVTTDILLPADWFGSDSLMENVTVFAKGLWFETNPDTEQSIFPGARSALVEINRTLFIAAPDNEYFFVHRPVLSMQEETILKRLLWAKFPDVFRR